MDPSNNPSGQDKAVPPSHSSADNVPVNPSEQGPGVYPVNPLAQDPDTFLSLSDVINMLASSPMLELGALPDIPDVSSQLPNTTDQNQDVTPSRPDVGSLLPNPSEQKAVHPSRSDVDSSLPNPSEQKDDIKPGCSNVVTGPPTPSVEDDSSNLPSASRSGKPAIIFGFTEEATSPEARYRNKRRLHHVRAELKRRDALKKSFKTMEQVLPTGPDAPSRRAIKAKMLKKSIDYIMHLKKKKKMTDEKVEKLQQEALGLRILGIHYEAMLEEELNRGSSQPALTDDNMFQVIRSVMDELFETYEQIDHSGFDRLEHEITRWVEDQCNPQQLREMINRALAKLQAQSNEDGKDN